MGDIASGQARSSCGASAADHHSEGKTNGTDITSQLEPH
jgi:hypothetical protein